MSTFSSLRAVALIAAVGLATAGCASTNNARQDAAGTTLTGSYIPQNVQRNGQIYNGSSSLRTLDQSDLSNTGAATPAEALRKQGVFP